MTSKKCLVVNLKKSRQANNNIAERGTKKSSHQTLQIRRDVELFAANNNTFLPILPKLSPSEYQSDIHRESTGKLKQL